MYGGLSHKTKQFLSGLIKVSILFGASYFVYDKLANNDTLDLQEFLKTIGNSPIMEQGNIMAILGLTFLNWSLEVYKWKTLVSTLKKITFRDALEQSLGAMTASLVTPNRIGEYGAKAIYYKREYRSKVMFLTLWGNMMQMLVTLLIGTLGFLVMVDQFDITMISHKIVRAATVVALFVALGIAGSQQRALRIKGFSFARIKGFVKRIPFFTHAQICVVSILRYAVFSFQFYFLLTLSGIEIAYMDAMIGISSMYLLASVVPTLTLFDVVIKSTAAVWVFGFFGVDELTILSVSTLMWLLNFILPSIFGGYYVLNFKLNTVEDDPKISVE